MQAAGHHRTSSSTARSSRSTRRSRLVQTWRMLDGPGLAAEGFTTLTYEIAEQPGGVTRLTVTHDVTDAPGIACDDRRRE